MDGTTTDSTLSVPEVAVPRLESLPKELGVLLIVAGVGGILLPGPVGTPFLIVGGLVLFPRVFQKFERGFAAKFPQLHRDGIKQVHRFVTDLERRYPTQI